MNRNQKASTDVRKEFSRTSCGPLAQMLGSSKKIYVHTGSEEDRMRFLLQAADEGFRTPDGRSPAELGRDDTYCVRADRTVVMLGWAGHCRLHNEAAHGESRRNAHVFYSN